MSKIRKARVLRFGIVPLLIILFFVFSSCMTSSNTNTYVKNKIGMSDIYSASSTNSEELPLNASVDEAAVDFTYRRACFFQKEKQHRLAVEEFERVLLKDPHHAEAYNGMGISYDRLGNYERAAAAYKQALELRPDLDYVYNNLGYSYLMKGDITSAITSFAKAVSLDARQKLYHNNLGLAYAMNGDHELALREFTLAGDTDRAHFIVGQICYQKGLYREAKKHFSEAIALNPESKKAQSYLTAATHLAEITGSQEPKEKDASEPFRDEPRVAAAEGRRTALDGDGRSDWTTQKGVDLPTSLDDTEILVANGNGVRHMARKTGNYLRANCGFEKIRLSNATHFDYKQSRIYYCDGYLGQAERIAAALDLPERVREVPHLSRGKAKIRVLVGKDLVHQLARLEKMQRYQ